MSSTRLSLHVKAPRALVYRAILDARSVQKWMVPTGMTSHVHAFDAREGGVFRISLTYTLADADGGTELLAVHDKLPPGLSAADNEVGWRISLGKLAALVEAGPEHARPGSP